MQKWRILVVILSENCSQKEWFYTRTINCLIFVIPLNNIFLLRVDISTWTSVRIFSWMMILPLFRFLLLITLVSCCAQHINKRLQFWWDSRHTSPRYSWTWLTWQAVPSISFHTWCDCVDPRTCLTIKPQYNWEVFTIQGFYLTNHMRRAQQSFVISDLITIFIASKQSSSSGFLVYNDFVWMSMFLSSEISSDSSNHPSKQQLNSVYCGLIDLVKKNGKEHFENELVYCFFLVCPLTTAIDCQQNHSNIKHIPQQTRFNRCQ